MFATVNRRANSRYRLRLARSAQDLRAVAHLRYRCFRARPEEALPAGLDRDRFDETSLQVIVEDPASARILACFRLALHDPPERLCAGYSAQFYDLSKLAHYPGMVGEIGRFCTAPGLFEPDIWRLALAGLGQIVVANRVRLLMGCSSFPGGDRRAIGPLLAEVERTHRAPERWRPRIRAPEVIVFDRDPARRQAPRLALPPLLRFYLQLGGWIADHAVVDRDLNTLHVFTGVEIDRIPMAWKRFLTISGGAGAAAGLRPRGRAGGLRVDAARPAV